MNLVEVGPGTGAMMIDILRVSDVAVLIVQTIKQFLGNFDNVQINMIEASENLKKQQQDRILKFL